jgi:hypothetical protein
LFVLRRPQQLIIVCGSAPPVCFTVSRARRR